MKKKLLQSYGIYLGGREEGRTAFQSLKRELDSLPKTEQLFFDFSGMRAIAPSWCDEFFGEAAIHYPGRVIIDETISMGLKKSFEVISDARKIDFWFGKFQE